MTCDNDVMVLAVLKSDQYAGIISQENSAFEFCAKNEVLMVSISKKVANFSLPATVIASKVSLTIS